VGNENISPVKGFPQAFYTAVRFSAFYALIDIENNFLLIFEGIGPDI
jgi:hypothetical protein